MIWVIDASVALRWLLEEEVHSHADMVLEKIVYDPDSFAVPELFAFEVFSVLHRLHPSGQQAFNTGIIPILQLGIFRQPMTKRLATKAHYFVNLGLTGYDACYAALALDLGGMWLTFDQKAHRLIKEENISCYLADKMPDKWST